MAHTVEHFERGGMPETGILAQHVMLGLNLLRGPASEKASSPTWCLHW